MKRDKIIYWAVTVIISGMMVMSAYMYLTADTVREGFVHLGFPTYFRQELAIAKIIGAVLLLAPVPARMKEWTYAGFAITFISAVVAHTSVDGIQTAAGPIVFMVLLLVSYLFYHKVYDAPALRAAI
ncbi:MAG: DoxX family protein [Bacteroidetes bacterium]|nr:DoxX family protein [Bacteroidota bacterium]